MVSIRIDKITDLNYPASELAIHECGMRIFETKDPDGNILTFNQDLWDDDNNWVKEVVKGPDGKLEFKDSL